MIKHMPIAEIKATFSECLRYVEGGEPVMITRHGKPVAALVPAEDMAQLDRLRAAGPEKGLASLAGGWEGSEELVELVRESPRRGQRSEPDLE